jgi:chromate transporter
MAGNPGTPNLEMTSGVPVAPAELGAVADMPAPSLLRLFQTFFKVGSTAFGMATLQSVRAVTVKLGWMSRAEIDEGLGLVQLYPGAMMVDLVTYIGYRKHGVPGALVAAAGFVAPSLILALALAWLYASSPSCST